MHAIMGSPSPCMSLALHGCARAQKADTCDMGCNCRVQLVATVLRSKSMVMDAWLLLVSKHRGAAGLLLRNAGMSHGGRLQDSPSLVHACQMLMCLLG